MKNRPYTVVHWGKTFVESWLHQALQNCRSQLLNFLLLPIADVMLKVFSLTQTGNFGRRLYRETKHRISNIKIVDINIVREISPCRWSHLQPGISHSVFFFQRFIASATPSVSSSCYINSYSTCPLNLILERYLLLPRCWFFLYDVSFAHCWLCFV